MHVQGYRCRVCGSVSDSGAALIDCSFCKATNSMVPNAPRPPADTVTMPRECPEHILAEFYGMDPGDVAALYAKFVRLARIP